MGRLLARVFLGVLLTVAATLPTHMPGLAADRERPPEQLVLAVVNKPFGAAIRSSTSSVSGTNVQIIAECGDVLTVTGRSGSWLQVYAYASYGWIGAARVSLGALHNDGTDMVPEVDCLGAISYQLGARFAAQVPSGCLSVRERPSREAGFEHCVPTGHLFFVINGPVDVDGDDWIEVRSVGIGDGWVRTDFIVPAF